MDWINVVVGAACGALGAVIAGYVIRDRKKNRVGYVVVLALTMSILFTIAREYVTPPIRAQYEVHEIERSLAGNPAFAAIKRYEAPTYRKIVERVKTAIEEGDNAAEVRNLIHRDVVSLVQRQLPHSSDEAAVAYMRVTVQELTELQHRGGDLCFRYLYPDPGQPIDLSNLISERTKRADLEALGGVVKSSFISPQSIPTDQEVAAARSTVIDGIAAKFGNDLAALQNPRGPGVDRAKVCAIIIDMYTRILRLPPTKAGKVIRQMMSPG